MFQNFPPRRGVQKKCVRARFEIADDDLGNGHENLAMHRQKGLELNPAWKPPPAKTIYTCSMHKEVERDHLGTR